MSSIDTLRQVVPPVILERAADISLRLGALGVPHVLVGGLAVGLHGHPRFTGDVDFMVGEEAFASTSPLLIYREELKALVEVGETDLMSVPPKYPWLAEELRLEQDVPVISLRGLVLMKLDAFRVRDQDDVRELLRRTPERIRGVRDYLQMHSPELVSRLAEVLAAR